MSKSGQLPHLEKQPYMARIIGAEAERKTCVEAKKCHLEWGERREKSQRSCDKEKMQNKATRRTWADDLALNGAGKRRLEERTRKHQVRKTNQRQSTFFPIICIIWGKSNFKDMEIATRSGNGKRPKRRWKIVYGTNMLFLQSRHDYSH